MNPKLWGSGVKIRECGNKQEKKKMKTTKQQKEENKQKPATKNKIYSKNNEEGKENHQPDETKCPRTQGNLGSSKVHGQGKGSKSFEYEMHK